MAVFCSIKMYVLSFSPQYLAKPKTEQPEKIYSGEKVVTFKKAFPLEKSSAFGLPV